MTTAPTPAPAKTLTSYRILKFPPPPTGSTSNASIGGTVKQGYEDVGSVQATNANQAVKTIAEKNGAGTYVAVPESSWKPVTVTVETQVVVKLGDST